MIGDIIFVRSNNFIGKQIRRLSGEPFNHVAIMVSDTELVEATYKGVKLEKISKYNKLVDKNKISYRLGTVKGLSESDIYSIVSFVYCQIGLKYDYIQFITLFFVFLFKLKRDRGLIDFKSAFICSELIADAFDNIGIIFNNHVDIDLMTPNDIANSDLIHFYNQ